MWGCKEPSGPTPRGFAAAMVSAGGLHTCGVTASGAAYCWGLDTDGQLGNGTFTTNYGTQYAIPAPVSGALRFATVSAGYSYTCGVTTAGAAYCWGSNTYAELGTGATVDTSAPQAVSGGLVFASVSAKADHTCGLTTDGKAYCWGINWNGRLGDGSTTGPLQCSYWACSATPVAVAGGLAFAGVSVGGAHTCALTTGGAAYCWGDNGAGQLGTGSTTGPESCRYSFPCSTTPAAVTGGHLFSALSAGDAHTCAVTSAGAAYCWGDNSRGQLGNGAKSNSSSPVPVSGGLTFTAISAGEDHTCGLTADGAAYCWGANTAGQIGPGPAISNTGPERCGVDACSTLPVRVFGNLAFAAVSAGGGHTCALERGGDAYCWGYNAYGQLGSRTFQGSPSPALVLSH